MNCVKQRHTKVSSSITESASSPIGAKSRVLQSSFLLSTGCLFIRQRSKYLVQQNGAKCTSVVCSAKQNGGEMCLARKGLQLCLAFALVWNLSLVPTTTEGML